MGIRGVGVEYQQKVEYQNKISKKNEKWNNGTLKNGTLNNGKMETFGKQIQTWKVEQWGHGKCWKTNENMELENGLMDTFGKVEN